MHNRENLKIKTLSFIMQIQGIQPVFMSDTVKTFLHAILRADNTKVGMLLLLLQKKKKKCVEPSFMTETIRT